jgi:hypothetical protein
MAELHIVSAFRQRVKISTANAAGVYLQPQLIRPGCAQIEVPDNNTVISGFKCRFH